MRLLILVVLLRSVCCTQMYDIDEIENEESKTIAGGDKNLGLLSQIRYDAEPFLIKGKLGAGDRKENYERDLTSYCIGRNRETKISENNRQSSNAFDDEIRNRCDTLFGFTGPTANDEPENLVRPCALDDWQCIRNYFAANSNCKPAYGPIPDPLYVDVNTFFLPAINATVSLPNLMVIGLSGARITEFYINKRSGNLVISFDLSTLNQTIPRIYFRYRQTAKESIVLAGYATINYRAVTFTAVVPTIPHLRLDLADIHSYAQDTTPFFFVGPGNFVSPDLDVITAFTQLNVLLPVIIREGLFFQSQLYASIYIQKNICGFGLKLISV